MWLTVITKAALFFPISPGRHTTEVAKIDKVPIVRKPQVSGVFPPNSIRSTLAGGKLEWNQLSPRWENQQAGEATGASGVSTNKQA